MTPVLATLVYCLRQDCVLLLRRSNPPFAGKWVAPGGKIERHESPVECAARELREETGLIARNLILRGIVREVSPRPDWQWLLFIYFVTEATGSVGDDCSEGRLQWWSTLQMPIAEMPEADRRFFGPVSELGRPLYEAVLSYDNDLNLVSVNEQNAYCIGEAPVR